MSFTEYYLYSFHMTSIHFITQAMIYKYKRSIKMSLDTKMMTQQSTMNNKDYFNSHSYCFYKNIPLKTSI